MVFFRGQAEEQHSGNAELMRAGGFLHKFIDGKLEDAGHRADGAADFFSGTGEERQDELLDAQAGLGHEPAQGGGLAQTARARGGKLSDG